MLVDRFGLPLSPSGVSRRSVLKGAAGTAALVAAGGLAAPAIRAQSPVRIGYVTPQSGPLAAFAEADEYILGVMREVIGDGIEGAGGTVPIEIVVRDSQSNPNRAAEVARDLIVDEGVQLMVVASTPETTNPVATQCEIEEIPCISTIAPWQPWYIGRQANPGDPASWEPFAYTWHFFWGLEDVIANFLGMWNQVETNKVVGGLFPNDADGNAWGDPNVGLPPALSAAGYTTSDPGRYQNLSDDFSAQINAFKAAGAEIVTGVVIPPDFTTFWTQANQQGFKPKVASVAKALLFPSSVEALGPLGHNLSSEVWWTPTHPFTSALTGASAADVAAGFTEATGRPWTQPIGFIHALFEVALDVLKRAEDASDIDAIAAAVPETDLQTVVGRVNWGKDDDLPPGVATNVSKTPLVGGQWRRKDDGTFDLVVVENGTAPEVPLGGQMQPIG
jgi:branched-chain amino acid transport system substrate-binding protein